MAERSYAVRLEAEYQAFVQAMEGAARAVDKVGDAAEKASKRVDSATKAQADAAGRLRTAEQQLADARAKHPAQSAQVVAAEEKVAKSRRDLDKATEDVVASEAQLRDAMAKTDAAATQQQTTFGRLADSAQKNRDAWDRAGTALAAFGAVTTVAVGATVKAAMDWESAWAGVTKTIDATPAQLSQIEAGLRGLAKTLPATHGEIAAVAEAAGQLGVSADGIVDFTKTMIDLGETTNLSADEAATSIAQMANVMGLDLSGSSDDVSRLGATLVALGNNGASTEKDILMMSQRIAGAGALVGATSGEVLALSNALSSMGVTAELGGSVTSRVLQRIYTAAQDGGEALEGFARVAGMSATDFATAFENDPIRALNSFTQGLNGVEQSGGNVVTTLSDLGIKSQEEQRVLLQLKASGDLLTDSLDLQAEAWEENSALLDEAAKRYETTEAKLQIARNSINDAAITIGDAFLPVLAQGAEAVAGLADAFSSLPTGVQQALGGLGGLVGVTSLLAGGFLLLFPRAMETVEALKTLGIIGPRTSSALRGVAGALTRIGGLALGVGAVAAATGILVDALTRGDVVPGANAIERAVRGIADSGGDLENLDAQFSNFGTVLGMSRSSVEDLGTALDSVFKRDVTDTLASWAGALPGVTAYTELAEERFRDLDGVLAQMASSGDAETVRETLGAIYAEAETRGISVEKVNSLFSQTQDALIGVEESAPAVAEGISAVGLATEEAQAAIDEWHAMVSDVDSAFSDIGGAYQGVIDKNMELAEQTAAATESSEDSWESFYDGTSVSMADWIAKLQEQATAQANWRDNVLAITGQIREEMPADMHAAADAMIDELIAMGPEGAAALQTFRDGTAAERLAIVEAWMTMGGDAANGFSAEVEAARAPVVTPEVDGTVAQEDLAILLAQINSAEGTVTVDGDWGPAGQVLTTATAAIDAAAGTVTIFGDDGQAVTTLSDYTASVDAARGTVTIRGNDAQGRATTVTLTNWVDSQGAAVDVGANDGPARATVSTLMAHLNNLRATVGVSADTTAAQMEINRLRNSAAIVVGSTAVRPEADGGVLSFFANGSENHVAQIAPAGAWRVWAEPETGGEAYIPLTPSKRARSEAILADVADRFGMALARPSRKYADGGIDNAPAYAVPRAYPAAGYSTTTVTKHSESHVHVQRASVAEVQAAQRAAEANDYEPGGGW